MFIVFYRWNISKMVLTLLYQYWIQKLNIEYSTISVSYETIKLRLFPGYSILYARRMPIWVSSIQCYSTDSNKNLNGHSPMVLKVWKFERTPTELLINFNAIRSLLFQDICIRKNQKQLCFYIITPVFNFETRKEIHAANETK